MRGPDGDDSSQLGVFLLEIISYIDINVHR